MSSFSNPEVQSPTVLVVMVNLTPAHSEPSSLLLLMLVHRLLILLRLQTPRLLSLFHNFGGEGGCDGVSFHNPPWPYSPGKMLKSSSNRFGMTTPPIVLTGSTAEEIIVEAVAIVRYLYRRPGKFDFTDQAFIWQAVGQKFLQS